MKELKEKFIRPGGKITDQFIIAVALSIVVMVIGVNISAIILELTNAQDFFAGIFDSDNLGVFFIDYLQFFGIWIAVWLFAMIPKANRPMMKSWRHHSHGNNFAGSLAGIALGFGTNALCVLISVLTGHIKLSYYGFEPWILLAFLVVVFIQSAAEELLDRFYLYQKLRRRYKSPLVAIIVNAAVFAAMHFNNPGFTAVAASQIVVIGILFSVIVYYYDSLWACMWFHAAWNYTQNLRFGLPNSGIVSEYSIFKLEAASATNGLFYNVNFGVEGSIGSTLVLLAVLIVFVLINRGKPEKRDRWAKADHEAELKAQAKEEKAAAKAKHAAE